MDKTIKTFINNKAIKTPINMNKSHNKHQQSINKKPKQDHKASEEWNMNTKLTNK